MIMIVMKNIVFSLFRNTVWKLQKFSFTQILCEINFEETRSSKTVDFATLGAEFCKIWPVSDFKNCRIDKIKIQSLKIG